jgi:hypothetical protein
MAMLARELPTEQLVPVWRAVTAALDADALPAVLGEPAAPPVLAVSQLSHLALAAAALAEAAVAAPQSAAAVHALCAASSSMVVAPAMALLMPGVGSKSCATCLLRVLSPFVLMPMCLLAC